MGTTYDRGPACVRCGHERTLLITGWSEWEVNCSRCGYEWGGSSPDEDGEYDDAADADDGMTPDAPESWERATVGAWVLVRANGSDEWGSLATEGERLRFRIAMGLKRAEVLFAFTTRPQGGRWVCDFVIGDEAFLRRWAVRNGSWLTEFFEAA